MRVQLALAEYEWWQIALAAVVVVVLAVAFLDVRGRYGSVPRPSPAPRPRTRPARHDAGVGWEDDNYDFPEEHRTYGYDDYGGGYGGGGGHSRGLLGDSGQLYTLVILGGLGYLCYKGIIPVHRMDWFQLYMLWNIVEPLLLGGRGRGFSRSFSMGFGRRRRFF